MPITRKVEQPSLMISARAGCGKTTTIVEGVKRILRQPCSLKGTDEQLAIWARMELYKPRSVKYTSFSNAALESIKSKLPNGCDVQGIHSMGFAILRDNGFASGHKAMQKQKMQWMIFDEYNVASFPEFNGKHRGLMKPMLAILSKGKANLLDLSSDSIESDVDKLVDLYGLDIKDNHMEQILEHVPNIMAMSKRKADKIIDFDDMLYLPIKLNLLKTIKNKIDLLLIDEVQDLSDAQQQIALAFSNKFIAVGDPFQSIFGFAGALPDAMDILKKRLNPVEMKLTKCFRCSKSVITEAQTIVPDIKALPSKPEGTVFKNFPYEDTFDIAKRYQSSSMAISRKNAPAIGFAIHCINKNIEVQLMNKDFVEELVLLINDLAPSLSEKPSSVLTRIDSWEEAQLDKFSSPSAQERFMDIASCLRSVVSGVVSMSTVQDRLNCLIQSNDGLRISTIHKAKGLEADHVFFLDEASCPDPKVRDTSSWQYQQERNLRYVAITRAISCLYLVSVPKPKSSSPELAPFDTKPVPTEPVKPVLDVNSLTLPELEELISCLSTAKEKILSSTKSLPKSSESSPPIKKPSTGTSRLRKSVKSVPYSSRK